MALGGRRAAYDLMEMQAPAVSVAKPKRKSAPKLIIDREGKDDQARYKGLKMTQVLDDNSMAEALEAARLKKERGERLRPKLVEEDYEQPFAGTLELNLHRWWY